MKIHLGKVVSAIIIKQRISKTEFAQKLHYSKQNINTLLKKEHWNSETIYRTSVLLQENIFLILANTISIKRESVAVEKRNTTEEKKEIELLKKEIQYLKEINKLLRKKH